MVRADSDDEFSSAVLSLLCSHYGLISMTYSLQQKERGSAERKGSLGALTSVFIVFLHPAKRQLNAGAPIRDSHLWWHRRLLVLNGAMRVYLGHRETCKEA